MIELSEEELGMIEQALKSHLHQYEKQIDSFYTIDEYLEILFKIRGLQNVG